MINLTTPLWSINWLVQEFTTVSIWDIVFFNIDVIFWGSHYLRWRSAKVQTWSIQNVQKWSPLISAFWWVMKWKSYLVFSKMTVVVPYSDMVFHTCFQPSLLVTTVSGISQILQMNFSWKSWLHLAHDCACTTGPTLAGLGRDGWMASRQALQTAGPPGPLHRHPPWPGKVLCLKVVIWSGKRCCNSCGDAWNVWGFLVWMFGNCCWSKFVKAGGLSWVIPFSIRSPVQQLALDQRWILKTFMKDKKMHM